MKKKEKDLGGRPPTVHADTTVGFRFDKDTIQALEKLAGAWGCSKNEAVRRAIKTCAGREG
jgi:hypothetical protein